MTNPLITDLRLGGYRSFGKPQSFGRFARVNLIIGPNNSGKSNLLRFVHDIYPKLSTPAGTPLGPLDTHFPDHAAFCYGHKVSLTQDPDGNSAESDHFVRPRIIHGEIHPGASAAFVLRVFRRKAELDHTGDDVWFTFAQSGHLITENWEQAFQVLDDRELSGLWSSLTGMRGGGRNHWYTQSLEKLTPARKGVSVVMIPAIRQVVSGTGDDQKLFGGAGLIEHLARLQNPDTQKQRDKEKFTRVSAFLKSVTDNRTAEIEIPYSRATIMVHMDRRTLPLESIGMGIHEVIILAAASTVLENSVICMEEPEIHLNPVLQRKLVRYLTQATSNQYLISTHSAALMDTPDAEIYHVRLRDGQSVIERVTSDRHRSAICEDLGYHPSDLLQANCLIWVEGPSDRIYIAHWIFKRAPDLQEGVHFSIMFYGGRLASHLTGNDLDEVTEDFISLRRLNRRAVILLDSDRSTGNAPLNTTKTRLIDEFSKGPGHAWITAGREIENYLPADQVREAIAKVAPSATPTSKFGRYSRMLAVKSPSGKQQQAPKVEVAKYIVASYPVDESRLDLNDRLTSLIRFIRDSNPSHERVRG